MSVIKYMHINISILSLVSPRRRDPCTIQQHVTEICALLRIVMNINITKKTNKRRLKIRGQEELTQAIRKNESVS